MRPSAPFHNMQRDGHMQMLGAGANCYDPCGSPWMMEDTGACGPARVEVGQFFDGTRPRSLTDPLPTTRTQDCLRALPRPSRVRARLTAHIKEPPGLPGRPLVGGTWLVRTLVIVIQAAGEPQWI